MQNNQTLLDRIIPESPNFQTELAEKIAEVAPETISDGKLDINKLRELVNGDVETSPEKFGLFWPGKQRSQAVAQLPTTATLKPAPEESVNWDSTKNIFIEGDNLEVLKILQNSYRRKIKMIYIDPPYNTGKEFIYPDNFQEGLQTYLEYTGQINEKGENTESKKETGGRKHSNWLNMMYPRLQLAKSLLTDDGVIFISIDDNEQANLKRICNEIFGEENFVASLTLLCNPKGRSQDKYFATNHEYVLVYTKKPLQKGAFSIDKDEKQIEKEYPYEDEIGKYRLLELRNTHREFGKHNRRNLYYPFYIQPETSELSLEVNSNLEVLYPIWDDGFEGCWTWDINKSKKDIAFLVANKINSGKWKVYRKNYANGADKMLKTILTNKEYYTEKGQAEFNILFKSKGKLFQSPKSVELLKTFLSIRTSNTDVVLDFFSGSASTAHAVMELNTEDGGNRKHIQVQLPEPTEENSESFKAGYKNIAELAKERIRRAGVKIREDYKDKLKERETPLDTGFRVFKLAQSNFVEWDEKKAKENPTQAVLDFANNKKINSTPEELLTEIILRSRITLDSKIEKKSLNSGGWVYVVDDSRLVAYVDDKPLTVEQANEIADMAPGKFVALDSAFNNNDALKINIANILRDKHVKEFKTI